MCQRSECPSPGCSPVWVQSGLEAGRWMCCIMMFTYTAVLAHWSGSRLVPGTVGPCFIYLYIPLPGLLSRTGRYSLGVLGSLCLWILCSSLQIMCHDAPPRALTCSELRKSNGHSRRSCFSLPSCFSPHLLWSAVQLVALLRSVPLWHLTGCLIKRNFYVFIHQTTLDLWMLNPSPAPLLISQEKTEREKKMRGKTTRWFI